MPKFKEWEKHFDAIPKPTLKRRMGAIGTLLRDPWIKEHYGTELNSLYLLMKGSVLYRE